MNQFSLGGAWSKGVGLFSGEAAKQAMILIGLGIAAPFIIQFALVGGTSGLVNSPLVSGPSGLMAVAGAGGVVLLAMAIGYVLQVGSFFASWRLGLARNETLVGAIAYGLPAAVVVIVGTVLAAAALGFVFTQIGALGAFLLIVAVLILFAMLYTLVAATLAVTIFVMLLLAMILGVTMGQAGFAATLVGGYGFMAVIAILLSILLLWLAARFSCTAAVMADRKSFNPFAAMAESWRLTAYDQFRVMLYLGLIGLVLAIVLAVGAVAIGVGFASSFQGGAPPALGIGALILGLIVGIPFAYLTVLLPGGIYRELAAPDYSAEIFA